MRLLCAVFILIISPSSFGVSLVEQLVDLGYEPKSCQRSEPSEYQTNDTTVHINVVNDLQVELQPAFLDLEGRIRFLKKRPPKTTWNDSTYAKTIWVWLDNTNKKCLGTTKISDVSIQSNIIRLSEINRQQIHAVADRGEQSIPASTIKLTRRPGGKKPSITDRERAALVGFYGATNGVSWRKNDGWLTDTNHCSWYGVTCKSGKVTSIELNANKVSGKVPAVIGELRGLKQLFLHSNDLTGDLPPEIGNLSELTHLHLGYNKLTGRPPSSMSRMRNLGYLYRRLRLAKRSYLPFIN